MDAALLSLLTGLISGIITAVVTYFATLSKVRLDLTIEYDKELHRARLEAYQLLWPKLKDLAQYSAPQPITYQIVKDTSEKMRDWYFDFGGIFLSRESREPYFELKKAMQAIIDNATLQNDRNATLDNEWIKPLHERSTALRKALSEDIGTRRQPFL
jgi:hypothetical protein